jgi:hypothetical protein
MIAPNIDATKFYYPNQEPPAAFLASFRRSVWKPSVSFFQGLAYKGWKVSGGHTHSFLQSRYALLRRKWLVNANPDLKKLMLMTRGMKVSLACMLRFWRVMRADSYLK